MQLILGGARSGKSRYAQERVEALGAEGNKEGDKKLIFLATAEARDGEMQKRIVKHRGDRGQRWQTCEEPLHLARALARISGPDNSVPDTWVLVDCLTLWISNCLHAGCWEKERGQLLAEVDRRLATGTAPHWLFVSNEVGSGVVPLGQLSREFVDASGWLHQALAERCDQVTLVVAGLPLQLKG